MRECGGGPLGDFLLPTMEVRTECLGRECAGTSKQAFLIDLCSSLDLPTMGNCPLNRKLKGTLSPLSSSCWSILSRQEKTLRQISVRVPGTQCLFCNSNGKPAHSEKITTIICGLILFTPHLYTHRRALCREFPRMSRLERDASDSHSPLGMRTWAIHFWETLVRQASRGNSLATWDCTWLGLCTDPLF